MSSRPTTSKVRALMDQWDVCPDSHFTATEKKVMRIIKPKWERRYESSNPAAQCLIRWFEKDKKRPASDGLRFAVLTLGSKNGTGGR
jgi:hypothetical protein